MSRVASVNCRPLEWYFEHAEDLSQKRVVSVDTEFIPSKAR